MVGFLDNRPVFKGHALPVTRRHVETLTELPDELLAPTGRDNPRMIAGYGRGSEAGVEASPSQCLLDEADLSAEHEQSFGLQPPGRHRPLDDIKIGDVAKRRTRLAQPPTGSRLHTLHVQHCETG